MTRLPSDERVRAWRLAGRFICHCDRPVPHRIGAFDALECQACWRLIIARDTATELLERVRLEELEP